MAETPNDSDATGLKTRMKITVVTLTVTMTVAMTLAMQATTMMITGNAAAIVLTLGSSVPFLDSSSPGANVTNQLRRLQSVLFMLAYLVSRLKHGK